MSITTTSTETNLETEAISTIADIRSQIIGLRAKERDEIASLRMASALEDARLRAGFQEAFDEAWGKHHTLASELADAHARKASIEASWEAGDASTSADDAAALDVAIKRLTGLEKAAERDLRTAQRKLELWLADDHLSYLAGDIIATVTDVPILHRKRPEDAPVITPALILSQTTPTIGYGTIETHGEVNVTVVGDPRLDWRAIRLAFEDAGCEVDVTEDRIVFTSASWPLTRLASPSAEALARFSRLIEEAWESRVELFPDLDRLRSLGYSIHPSQDWTGHKAFSDRLSETFSCDDGKATGITSLALSIQRDSGRFEIEDIEDQARSLIDLLAGELVGTITEAGEIVSVSLVSVERGDGSIWNQSASYGPTGNPVHLPTVNATIRVDYLYEPVRSAAIAND